MPNDPTTDVRFLLSIERDRHGMSGLAIIAHPVHFTDEGVRNIIADSWRPEPLADFEVRALADSSPATFGDTYGWSREYRNVFSVDLERAAVMLKHLRALDRSMLKFEQEFGYAGSFAAYLARVASALKIRQFGWKTGGESSIYAGNEYRWGDATRMSDWVTRQLADYRKVGVA